ncbi:MAG: hypothetical protein NC924_05920 [Candidatus Omnitrophica bacterium]|nr:hypothetical protein [Candidatus Omnitrophota bacterium]
MITINLLPPEYKQRQAAARKQVPLNLLLLSISAVLLVLVLIISALNINNAFALKAVSGRLGDLTAQNAAVTEVRRKLESLRATTALFEPLRKPPFYWSEKMNLLSNAMIPGVWLRLLTLEKKMISDASSGATNAIAYLKIEGTAYAAGGKEMSVISEVVRNLRAQETFVRDFKKLDVEGFLRREIGGIEVMDFTVICYFKEGVVLE